MQTRRLGKTDLHVSIIGMGGIVVMKRPQEEANRAVADAVDRGVTYFDVAPTYGDAEERLGPALQPFRDHVTLACKTTERTAEGSRRELEQSLKQLRTDRFDIYQMHALTTMDDVETALGPGGAIETFLAAKEKGQARYLGFSAHGEEAALAVIESGYFDTVLFPLNYVIFESGHFGPALLDAANRRGMGILALKAMARGKLEKGQEKKYAKCWYEPEDRPDIAELLLRYTLSLPGVSAALPPGDERLFELALTLADNLTPLDQNGRVTLDAALANETPLFANPKA